jgi:hypothetical protein
MPKRAKSDQFRANADECERQARRARDPQVIAQFRDLAKRWRDLAAQVEQLGKGDTDV